MDQAQTVARALALLEILGKHRALTATGIIELSGYHRSTTYRLLGTLRQLGYVRRDEKTGIYTLSGKILSLASSVTEQFDIVKTAKPFLQELQAKNGETVHLAALDNGEVVYLDKIESSRALRVVMSSRTGHRAPLYCTGIGKVFLASMRDDEIRLYLESTKLRSFTENTITGTGELMDEIAAIRKGGYALDREEHEVGVFCVAAGIRNPAGEPLASFSVSLPSVRRNQDLERALITDVLDTAASIERLLFGDAEKKTSAV